VRSCNPRLGRFDSCAAPYPIKPLHTAGFEHRLCHARARHPQGGVSIRQLDFYLDEFVFRFNRRKSKSRGLLFHRLMEQAVTTTPKPAKTIIGGRP